jgi:thioredoxin reductase (NADPH)
MDLVTLDEKGFVLTGAAVGASSPFAASRPGIFAVGDVRSGSVKRVASAVGEGSVVISKVWEFVEQRRSQNASAPSARTVAHS